MRGVRVYGVGVEIVIRLSRELGKKPFVSLAKVYPATNGLSSRDPTYNLWAFSTISQESLGVGYLKFAGDLRITRGMS